MQCNEFLFYCLFLYYYYFGFITGLISLMFPSFGLSCQCGNDPDLFHSFLSVSFPLSSAGNPYYDSLGSLGVGTLLGGVSAFLIYTNTEALLGRSIQPDRVQKLTEFLENDPAVRSVIGPAHCGAHTDVHGHSQA